MDMERLQHCLKKTIGEKADKDSLWEITGFFTEAISKEDFAAIREFRTIVTKALHPVSDPYACGILSTLLEVAALYTEDCHACKGKGQIGGGCEAFECCPHCGGTGKKK